MNNTASYCACGLAWDHTGKHAHKQDCAYCEPDRWARQLSERGSTVPVCAQHRLSPRPRLGECDHKELSIKQCPKCLTMKSFEGESCARCNVKGESASIEEAKDLAWLLVGGITFGDSRDTPEWRKTILDSAERIILEYFQRVGTIKGDRLIEMAREEERTRITMLLEILRRPQGQDPEMLLIDEGYNIAIGDIYDKLTK